MSARYTPVPSQRSDPDAERELDDAFESDNEDDTTAIESTPLTHNNVHSPQKMNDLAGEPTSSIPGAYDFEREYDYPPPGSPPRPSSQALPNDYGNSNGLLPTTPARPAPAPTPSFFRRAVGALLPSHYVRVPTESSRAVGGGTENDGVFANVMAKPQRAQVVHNEDGSVYMVPEENQKEVPPSYADAQADAVPPYWETTVHAPSPGDPNADIIVDDLPTGSFLVFAMNLFISFFFQFIGFLFTYLMHTSHAAKYGSRAGLGLTLIQFGFYSRSLTFIVPGDDNQVEVTSASEPPVPPVQPVEDDSMLPAVSSKDWLAFLFMTLGWFLLLSSVIGFWRVKRWESSIRQASTPITPEAIERDIAIRRNIANVFGVTFSEDEEATARAAQLQQLQQQEDARLTRDLRAAGLL
ncbi:Metal homeostatis protein BSD2 [Hypsizygus marmoreus]|uniref:Metal homeostatis protein BSD2 n=1 Tax=Hypsizygus marmoreus TaxID=39966 RepID=A0A369JUW0_HYPMA|nr:Metal homeostatis protein BSD2 [Hypsizygus marmoreus]